MEDNTLNDKAVELLTEYRNILAQKSELEYKVRELEVQAMKLKWAIQDELVKVNETKKQ